ncbi:hypothetical protein N866_11575 [Actinotalea ferrariae CF5-4]|uniref:Uncharacterized protein n=1 Tax=Actinotalea ferrariae CF5-4 TaxID=948458 RepID=A0A021VM19_9CELL|nr:hypothetical protein [Actinotalea ferrariae]EYR62128.1 hypothetical protein N866_11575 [Actinotalea ferrariae CF5-4]
MQVLEILGALAPSVGVGLIFWLAMRKIIHADRNERAAQAALDRQHLVQSEQQVDAGRQASVLAGDTQRAGAPEAEKWPGGRPAPAEQVATSSEP